MSWDDPETIFDVVVNHEEQYSIWPDYKELPLGWKKVGQRGKKDECLAYIKEVWTDIRPLSLRRHLEQQARADRTAGTAGGAEGAGG